MNLLYIWMCGSECTFRCLYSKSTNGWETDGCYPIFPLLPIWCWDTVRQREMGVGCVLGFNARTCCATSARWLIRVQAWWRSKGGRRELESERYNRHNHSSSRLCRLKNLKVKSSMTCAVCWSPATSISSVYTVQSTCVCFNIPVHVLSLAHAIKQVHVMLLYWTVSGLYRFSFFPLLFIFRYLIVKLTRSYSITKWAVLAIKGAIKSWKGIKYTKSNSNAIMCSKSVNFQVLNLAPFQAAASKQWRWPTKIVSVHLYWEIW